MRLFSSGWELNWTGTPNEFSAISGGSIQTTIKRSGSYAWRVSSLVSGTAQDSRYSYSASTENTTFLRIYFRFDTLPSAENRIISINNSTSSTTSARFYVTIDASGVLRLYDEDGRITAGGPNANGTSNALQTGQWYGIELQLDRTPTAGSHIVKGRYYTDGGTSTEFAAATNRNISGAWAHLHLGGNLGAEAQTQGDWYLDDLALNDSTGSYQNSYPGPGHVIHLRPNAVGANNAWSRGGTDSGANWSQLDEVTPNDVTDYVASNTLDQKDDYNVESSSVMQAHHKVNYVGVGVRFNGASATNVASFVLRLTAGATTDESTAMTPNSTSWGFNTVASPRNYNSIGNNSNYEVPGTDRAYTKADLDSIQIGVRISTGNTNNVQVTLLFLQVDYDDLMYNAVRGALAFGEQSPTNSEASVSYQTFTNGSGAVPSISGDADWGKLSLATGSEARSKVYDFGDSNSRLYTITRDVYGIGSGSATLKIRGSTTTFNQDDASPSWTTYTGPITQSWRYVQIQVVGA